MLLAVTIIEEVTALEYLAIASLNAAVFSFISLPAKDLITLSVKSLAAEPCMKSAKLSRTSSALVRYFSIVIKELSSSASIAGSTPAIAPKYPA